MLFGKIRQKLDKDRQLMSLLEKEVFEKSLEIEDLKQTILLLEAELDKNQMKEYRRVYRGNRAKEEF